MDLFIRIVLVAVLVLALWRLFGSFRRTRRREDKGAEIQRKLAELRKKRDED
ncbi:hypothetical protein [Paenibacillus ehimensis]|uniref:DUF4083 domain-containing protein n=1 Tax=Paenibacillus ehimensis TaxID=79264 RepID=A0ABT8V5G2_9BACL|nr:hypothetical protein [Paenibacillus ehimensis]MDO3675512.1 hypothetical protein [Paenibacillus ehimensis]MEC0209512.1 hypothetical protein [Paenibacillus ehimensis]